VFLLLLLLLLLLLRLLLLLLLLLDAIALFLVSRHCPFTLLIFHDFCCQLFIYLAIVTFTISVICQNTIDGINIIRARHTLHGI
jgi:hypothetical protein